MTSLDRLKLQGDDSCRKMIQAMGEEKASEETVEYSDKVTKINRKGKEQTRILLITSKAVYNCLPNKVTKCKRKILIKDIASMTISTVSDEFVLHVPSDYDYRYKSSDKENVGKVLKKAFGQIYKQKIFPIQRVDTKELWNQTMTKDQARLMTQQDREERLMKFRKLMEEGLPMEADDREKDGGPVHNLLEDDSKISTEDFDFLKVIGRGAFGKVMQVKHKENGNIYAMKILRKKQILSKNQIEHTKAERKILQAAQHPFLMKLRYAFQTDSKLYFVLDYFRGGELFFHLKKKKRFTEPQTQIFVAEVALALGHLHSLDIVYRDLKPENILLHQSGHICLTDFGLSKDLGPAKTEAHTFCGTPEYLAPEIVEKTGHGKAVDWWSLGILCYELCIGIPPFYHQNLHSMYQKIRTESPKFPGSMSKSCQDLIVRFLIRNPKERLGSGPRDVEEVKRHDWFAGLNWEDLLAKKVEPKYIPKVKSEMDTSNFSTEFTKESVKDTYVEPVTLAPDDEFVDFTFQQKSNLA